MYINFLCFCISPKLAFKIQKWYINKHRGNDMTLLYLLRTINKRDTKRQRKSCASIFIQHDAYEIIPSTKTYFTNTC